MFPWYEISGDLLYTEWDVISLSYNEWWFTFYRLNGDLPSIKSAIIYFIWKDFRAEFNKQTSMRNHKVNNLVWEQMLKKLHMIVVIWNVACCNYNSFESTWGSSTAADNISLLVTILVLILWPHYAYTNLLHKSQAVYINLYVFIIQKLFM